MNVSTAMADSLLRQASTRIPRYAGGRARRSAPQHTVSSMLRTLAPPHARLATRLRHFVTNRYESCGLIDRYEEAHYAIERRTPHETLHHLMEARSLTHKDVWTLFGSKGVASEVLNDKRAINKSHARALADFFHVSADLFIGPKSAPRRRAS